MIPKKRKQQFDPSEQIVTNFPFFELKRVELNFPIKFKVFQF